MSCREPQRDQSPHHAQDAPEKEERIERLCPALVRGQETGPVNSEDVGEARQQGTPIVQPTQGASGWQTVLQIHCKHFTPASS